MKYLYCYQKSSDLGNNEEKWGIEDVKVFTPKIRKILLPGESWDIKKVCVRILFQVITRGKTKIYYVFDGQALKHMSYVIPKCNKFPFLKKNDYEIGPCYTYPKYRGKGIYPMMLRSICDFLGNDGVTFYMIVDDANVASMKGIEKAGFVRCGTIEVTRFTKCYRLVK